MSGRALLAIGCNSYTHMKPLGGAEADARAIYECLIRPDVGDYDVSLSRSLLSPTLQEVREALTTILFGNEPPDTLTIAFAGHGGVSGGSFYMALKDSRNEALSATALSLADLFRMIAEAKPTQTYLIIDACEAGGLISDLNVVLKSDIMGKLGTPGITLLATAASDQSAVERAGHGVGTAALLDCISGTTFLQDSTAALDLVEIGRAVSDRVNRAGEQMPVVWGLNLYGPSSFCKNPHASTGDAPLRSVLRGWPNAESTVAIRDRLPTLWEAYVSLSTKWDARDFVERIAPIIASLASDPLAMVNFVSRIAETFAAQATASADRFREIEVRAACLVPLLAFSETPQVDTYIISAAKEVGVLIETAITDVITAIDGYEFALVTGAMADLYHLPIRISKLLGWASYAVHTKYIFGLEFSSAKSGLEALFDRLFAKYSLSIVAMSDCQAAATVLTLTAADRAGLREQGERLIGHLFASCIECQGRVARDDLEPKRVLNYLLARHHARLDQRLELVAQPSELVMALLRCSRLFDLSDEFDCELEILDHLSVSAFLPENYTSFWEKRIEQGANTVFKIGHDVWTVAEIEQSWPAFGLPARPSQELGSMMSSLLFPDRVPWFLLRNDQSGNVIEHVAAQEIDNALP